MYDTANDYSLSSTKNFGNTDRKNRVIKTHCQPNIYIYTHMYIYLYICIYIYIGLSASFDTRANVDKV
jgi:hypothetical protein